eukprot:GHVP01052251.1.p1 GENE.GHVP01052251.1~~GHVP01052251.1.p1  ORF type:complete len:234 (+),score=49.06 GHVP01052251.1:44-745(+)
MHFDLIKKTSEELNAAALQTNIGDNLFKENLPCEDWKVEDLRFYGKFGKPSRQNESSSQDDSTGWEATNFAFAHDEGTTPFLKSQIEEIKEKMLESSKAIFAEIKSLVKESDKKGLEEPKSRFEQKFVLLETGPVFVWHNLEVDFPKDKNSYWTELVNLARVRNDPSIFFKFFLEGKIIKTEGSETKPSFCFCVTKWDQLQDYHPRLKKMLEELNFKFNQFRYLETKLKECDP